MSEELNKLLYENDLNYQSLNKMDDEWVLVNNNMLYYVASYYGRKKRTESVEKCLNIIRQHFDDIEVLHYYGIDETGERLMYHHIPAKDAKIIFNRWAKSKEICGRPLVVLKDIFNDIPFPPSKLPELRKKYLEAKKKEQKWKEHQKELKYRIEKGYMV